MQEKKKEESPTLPHILHKKPLSDKAKKYSLKIIFEYIEELLKRAEDQASAEGVDVVSKSHIIKANDSFFCRPKRSYKIINLFIVPSFWLFATIIINDFLKGSILGITHLILILLMIICVLVYSSFIR